MKVILKELRETRGNLVMSNRANLIKSGQAVDSVIDECSQLIAIFVKSIQTAEKRDGKNLRTEERKTVKGNRRAGED